MAHGEEELRNSLVGATESDQGESLGDAGLGDGASCCARDGCDREGRLETCGGEGSCESKVCSSAKGADCCARQGGHASHEHNHGHDHQHDKAPKVLEKCHDSLKVEALCCDDKSEQLRDVLLPVAGVLSVSSDSLSQEMQVSHDSSIIRCDSIVELLNLRKLRATALQQQGLGGVGNATKLQDSVLRIDGMCCASEARILETVLAPVEGVEKVIPNVILKNVTITHSQAVSVQTLCDMLNHDGLDAALIRDGWASSVGDVVVPVKAVEEEQMTENLRGRAFPKPRVMLALLFWLVSLLHYVQRPAWMESLKYVAIGSIALCLPPILIKAFQRMKNRALDVNILMGLAVIGAVALQDYSEAAAVVTLFSLSDWLESRATHRVREAMTALFALSPNKAIIAATGEVVAVETVTVGTRLAVPNGEKFPLDGVIMQGETFADESALTGESRPIKKCAGDRVSGGTVNLGSFVEMCSEAAHQDSAVSRMLRLIEEAHSQRAPTQQLIEQIARVYTPVVFLSALLLATIPWAIKDVDSTPFVQMALVLLVVACPCALVISTPITYVCGLAHAARKGILIKGGRHLETLGRVKTVCLDKTGTLTRGKFELLELDVVLPSDAVVSDEQTLLSLIYQTEQGSSHPIAAALCAGVEERVPEVESRRDARLEGVETVKGEGLRATLALPSVVLGAQAFPDQELCCGDHGCSGESISVTLEIGNSRLGARVAPDDRERAQRVAAWESEGLTAGWIALNGVAVAVFCVGDQVRAEARGVVAELRDRFGIASMMLTGDNEGAARAVSDAVGISTFYAALLPEDKVRHVRSVDQVVAMVGDGVNDAPALATADVSVSLGCIGSAAALETADVALMQDDLRMLVKAVRIGRLCYRKILENIAFSVISKLVVLVLTLSGVVTSLWLAIAVDVGGMLAVTLNSMTVLGHQTTAKSAVPQSRENLGAAEPLLQNTSLEDS